MSTIDDIKKKYQKKISLDEINILLCFILNKEQSFILAHQDFKLPLYQKLKLKYFFNKRINGWSIASIMKEKWFYGIKFFVNKNVLIPRPETEIIINEIKKINPENNFILDVGTGSGCIIITLAKILNRNNKFSAVDISPKTLLVAKKNAKKYKQNISFYTNNLLNNADEILPKKQDIIIIANLPYLTKEQIKNSPSIKKEPLVALDGGNDGLALYKMLFKQINEWIKKQKVKNKIVLFLEIDPSQNKKIKNIIQNNLNITEINTIKDYGANDRIIKINLRVISN